MYAYMKRTSLFLGRKQVAELRKISEETGAPVAELIRRAVDEYVARRKAATPTPQTGGPEGPQKGKA